MHFVDAVNSRFTRYYLVGGEHIFFRSHAWWSATLKEWRKDRLPLREDYEPARDRSYSCVALPRPTYPTASGPKLRALYSRLCRARTLEEAQSALAPLVRRSLPATCKDPRAWWALCRAPRKVLILGAGPVGLFTALYLQLHIPDVAVLLADRRVQKEGVRRPYDRQTMFGIDVEQVSAVFPQFGRWAKGRHFDFIFFLENLLFVAAFARGVPVCFTSSDLVAELDPSLVFDCTGGRRGSVQPPPSVPRSTFTKGDLAVRYHRGYYRLFRKGRLQRTLVYAFQLFDRDMNLLKVGNLFAFPTVDKRRIERFRGCYFTAGDFTKFSRGFRDAAVRSLFRNITSWVKGVAFVRLTPFHATSYHAPCAAFRAGETTYVALGNTLGSSEFGIHFGLKHAMLFSREVCHLIPREGRPPWRRGS